MLKKHSRVLVHSQDSLNFISHSLTALTCASQSFYSQDLFLFKLGLLLLLATYRPEHESARSARDHTGTVHKPWKGSHEIFGHEASLGTSTWKRTRKTPSGELLFSSETSFGTSNPIYRSLLPLSSTPGIIRPFYRTMNVILGWVDDETVVHKRSYKPNSPMTTGTNYPALMLARLSAMRQIAVSSRVSFPVYSALELSQITEQSCNDISPGDESTARTRPRKTYGFLISV
ncbi:hypothetical protein PM082_024337 [Marasmius tenuissimus]|nr:hypothetical protein PM082_024337 [Marasmius tenuissimus]